MSYNTREYHADRREDWATPQDLFDKVNRIFDFQIDLAARADNAKCILHIEEQDGPDEKGLLTENLTQLVVDKGVNPAISWAWCNPPYGPQGCGKMIDAIFRLPNTVSLIPAPVGAKWFLKCWREATALVFFHGRLRFEGALNKAMFDSVLVVKGGVYEDQLQRLSYLGTVVEINKTRGYHE